MNELEIIESLIKQFTLEIESYAIHNMILMSIDEIEENLKRSYRSDKFIVEYDLGKLFPKSIENKSKELILSIGIKFNRTVIANTFSTQGFLIDTVVKTKIYDGKYDYDTENLSLYFTPDRYDKLSLFMKNLLQKTLQ